MKKFSVMTFKMLSAFFIASQAMADEGEQTQDEKQHIQPGTRAVTHLEWVKMQEAREAEEKLGEEPATEAIEESTEEETSNLPSASYHGSAHFTSHTGAFHNPILVSPLGDMVELEDGSIWSVASGDSYKTFNWLTSDLVILTPNHEWFSSYRFRMTNQNTGVSVKCNLNLGPIYNGIFTHWIVAINYFTDEICLEDGSIWKISGFDSSVFSKWYVNDTIIIGVNDGFLSSSRPNILINVNTLTYVRANCTW